MITTLEVEDTTDARVELINAATVKSEPIRWLWPGWLARGKLHVIAGAPGTGKTTIAMAIAAAVSGSHALPGGHKPAPGRVLIWSGEDDFADTLVPRLRAAGADLSRVELVKGIREGADSYAFDPAQDVPKLAAALAGADDLALIVVDPLVSAVLGDSHKNAEVRRSLAPLVELAQRIDAALVGITHYSKGTQGREPLERVSGSLAFGALARLVFGTVRQKSDDDNAADRYLLARVKSNIGPDGGGFAYAFEQVDNGSGIVASRIIWGGALEGSARDLLAEAETEPDDGAQDAASFLRELLADGEKTAKWIFTAAASAGYSKDAMHRAKRKIGATVRKVSMTEGWAWCLPGSESGAEDREGGEGSGLEKNANFGHEVGEFPKVAGSISLQPSQSSQSSGGVPPSSWGDWTNTLEGEI
ncbi:MAG TPA: AAA family ATPase [Rhodanobacteraceae bacterium]|nr:AAA family ATPase [Rhodanobacteraceae bacterium]